jgi:signal transduction histidine kinase
MAKILAGVRGAWPLRPAGWLVFDWVAAALLAVLMLRGSPLPRVAGGPAGLGEALALAMCAGVAIRRLATLPAFILTVAASTVSAYLGFGKDPMVALALVLYTVAARASRAAAIGALLLAEAAVLASSYSPAHALMPPDRVSATATVQAAAWTVGVAVRTQRAYAAGLREQAERRVQAEIDRSSRALAEERLRIARELHDIVAHTMSVIAVQASVGAHVIDTRPAEGRNTLRTIEETSRTALRELRLMLGVLRESDTAPPQGAELLPAPGLSALPALITRTRSTGLAIDLSVTGAPRQLSDGVGLAAYRIVQEALTNVVRHAHAEHARVELVYQPGSLDITITDDGTGAAAPPSGTAGHGLIGMRERVALHGGEFTAGPRHDRGYRVHAVLPIVGTQEGAA